MYGQTDHWNKIGSSGTHCLHVTDVICDKGTIASSGEVMKMFQG